MSRRIIVPLDGSVFAESALPRAMGMACEGDVLDLVTAVEGAPPFAIPDYHTLAKNWAQRYLDGVLERMPEGPWTLEHHVLVGAPHEQIRWYVEEADDALVVMATHGRGPLTRAWLGSMADNLLRTCTNPIFLVRPEKRDDPPPLEPAGPIKRILVPLDGSELAEEAIQAASAFATPDTTAHFVRVVQYPLYFTTSFIPDIVPDNRDILEQASQAARNYLREAAERTYGDGITKQTEVLVSDQPANAISEYAEKHDIDLIVMSSHGRGGITRVALGSVADKVIRGAKTPVLVLRPTDEAAEDDQQSEAAAANA